MLMQFFNVTTFERCSRKIEIDSRGKTTALENGTCKRRRKKKKKRSWSWLSNSPNGMVKKSCYQQNDYTQLYTPASSSSLFPTRPTTTTTKLFLEDTHFPFLAGVLKHLLHILKDSFIKEHRVSIPHLHICKFCLATQKYTGFAT